ncbi:hypothetical protein LIER_29717 [Lithospermum erythrorhizon]|uniref:Uncharacterized protein n=1 Tax=Lithospermum erythrorhizon TaxID=34254 RepID=A0AAV3RNM9_LITER
MLKRLQWHRVPGTWLEEIGFMIEKCRGKSFKGKLSRLAFCVVIYHVWIEHNNRIFKGRSCDVEAIFSFCVNSIRDKVYS